MISKYSVKRPFTILVTVILIVILGGVSFFNLTEDLLPNVKMPYVAVMTNCAGSSPEEIEAKVTKPIELAMASMAKVEEVKSTTRENSSIVVLHFAQFTNLDSATLEIREKLDLLRENWDESVYTPVITKLDPNTLPVMVTAVNTEGLTVREASELLTDKVIPKLKNVEGVATVEPIGLIEEQLNIVINQEKIDSTNTKLVEQIQTQFIDAEEKIAAAKKELEENLGKIQEDKAQQTQQDNTAEGSIKAAKEKLAQSEKTIAESEKAIAEADLKIAETEANIDKREVGLNSTLSQLQASIKILEDKGEAMDETDKAALEGFKKQLEQVKTNLEGIAKEKQTLAAQKQDLAKKKTLLTSSKADYEKALSALEIQETQLQNGQEIFMSQFDTAYEQLMATQEQLDEQLKDLNNAKEEVIKESDVNAIIKADMLKALLQAENFSMPAGHLSGSEGVDYLVRVGEKFLSLSQLEDLLLYDTGLDGVDPVTLVDVADVVITDNSESTYSNLNNIGVVFLKIQKQSGFSSAEVTKKLQKAGATILDNYQTELMPLLDQGEYIHNISLSMVINLAIGFLLALIIIALLLMDLRPSIVLLFTVPVCLAFAIGIMYLTQVTVNLLSLAGLALGMGMVAQHSIIAIENIYRLRREGQDVKTSAAAGVNEIVGSVLTSSITLICLFLPIIFINGVTRRLLLDVGFTVLYSILAGLLMTLTFIPMMSSGIFKKINRRPVKLFDRISAGYAKVLGTMLKYKALVIIFTLVLLIGSGFVAMFMGTSFIPEANSSQLSLTVRMPEGTTLEDSMNMASTITGMLEGIEEVENVGSMISPGSEAQIVSASKRDISMYVTLAGDKKRSSKTISQEITNITKDLDCNVEVSSSNMDLSALGGKGLTVRITGYELEDLQFIAKNVANLLRETEGTRNVFDGIENPVPEIQVNVKKDEARQHGLTVAQVYDEINKVIAAPRAVTVITIDSKDYPVLVIDSKTQSLKPSDILELSIKVEKDGDVKNVPIRDIAEITEQQSLSSIYRYNSTRALEVTAEVEDGYNIGKVSRAAQKVLDAYKVPAGYHVVIAGENESINGSLKDLLFIMLLALLIAYLIMVAKLQSLFKPLILVFAVPIACSGGLLALFATGKDISTMAMVGFLLVIGTVFNSGSVIIDAIDKLKNEGKTKRAAVLEASAVRLRPSLAAGLAIIFALLPLAIGLGKGADVIQPMAIAAVGGMLYTILLLIFLVPVMYDLFVRTKRSKEAIEEERVSDVATNEELAVQWDKKKAMSFLFNPMDVENEPEAEPERVKLDAGMLSGQVWQEPAFSARELEHNTSAFAPPSAPEPVVPAPPVAPVAPQSPISQPLAFNVILPPLSDFEDTIEITDDFAGFENTIELVDEPPVIAEFDNGGFPLPGHAPAPEISFDTTELPSLSELMAEPETQESAPPFPQLEEETEEPTAEIIVPEITAEITAPEPEPIIEAPAPAPEPAAEEPVTLEFPLVENGFDVNPFDNDFASAPIPEAESVIPEAEPLPELSISEPPVIEDAYSINPFASVGSATAEELLRAIEIPVAATTPAPPAESAAPPLYSWESIDLEAAMHEPLPERVGLTVSLNNEVFERHDAPKKPERKNGRNENNRVALTEVLSEQDFEQINSGNKKRRHRRDKKKGKGKA
ncbi:MAG: efflux RND transporter permease subunit [Oscillospiraceae bacterium]|jgi:HAE1 family hydrophobic/amphiphilic exporter-1|nr:efflux RND transporter permease subunit [Oscillospiraceae bacterium]